MNFFKTIFLSVICVLALAVTAPAHADINSDQAAAIAEESGQPVITLETGNLPPGRRLMHIHGYKEGGRAALCSGGQAGGVTMILLHEDPVSLKKIPVTVTLPVSCAG